MNTKISKKGFLILELISVAGLIILGTAACIPQATVVPGTPTTAVTTVVETPSALPPTAVPATETVAPSDTPVPPTETAVITPTVPVSTTAPALTYISMKDENNGWGLTQNQILRTSNGGSTWENVSPEGGFGSDVFLRGFFLDANTGWVLVPNPQDFNAGTLYRTGDAGHTWEMASVPFGGGYLQFLDAQNGWMMADRGAGAGSMAVDIYKTTDAGNTWTQVYSIDPSKQGPNDLPLAGIKSGLTFLDMTHGWVTGSEPKDGYSWLFATQDGGTTWQHQVLPLPSGYMTSTLGIDPPRFFTSTEGVLPVTLFTSTSNRDFYVTHDGGATWTSTTPVQNSGVYDVTSMQDFVVWDGATMDVSHDGGQTWTAITPNVNLSQIISQLDFVDANTGWVVTMDTSGQSQIYKTTDGGSTWTALFP